MRKGILLLSLLLLAYISRAQLNVTEFVTPYLYDWENYSKDVRVTNAALASGNYSIVVINGTYTFLLNLSDNIYFVENQGHIDSLLREYYSKTTYPTAAELDALNSSFQSFLGSRGLELECKVVTGLASPDGSERFSCTPENRCESCQSVPVCRDVMKGTQQTSDPMSSVLVQSIMRMEYDFHILNTNVTVFLDNFANISSATSQSLVAMKQSISGIKTAVDDLGKPPVRTIYETYQDFKNTKALGYCRNFYTAYNLTALNSALSKVTDISSRVPTQQMVETQISSVYNYTPERKANKTINDERKAFLAFYSTLVARKDNITNRANVVLSLITDNTTRDQLDQLDSMLSDIRELGDNRDYAGVDLLSENFSQTADRLESHVSGLATTYSELLLENQSTSDALFEAWLRVGPEDLVTKNRLDDLYTQKESIEFTIYNSSPLSLGEADNLTEELTSIRFNANDIRDAKKSASMQQMNNLVETLAKPVVSLSLSLLDPFMPLSYSEKEKNAPTIIGVALVIFDILFFLVCVGTFLYFVRSRKIELHKVARILWAFIFAFIALILALGSLALYNVADMQSNPTTYDVFLNELKGSTQVGVVADLTGLNGTIRESLVNCSERVALKLGSLQKNVMHYGFDGENCMVFNETQSRTSCENNLDAHPVIILRSGEEDKATFRVLYMKEATLEGDENFFDECAISRVVG